MEYFRQILPLSGNVRNQTTSGIDHVLLMSVLVRHVPADSASQPDIEWQVNGLSPIFGTAGQQQVRQSVISGANKMWASVFLYLFILSGIC